MRFGSRLVAQSVPEWRANYIDYARLKRLLADGNAGGFWELLEDELDRVSRFFMATLLDSAARQGDAVRMQNTRVLLELYERLLKLRQFRSLNATGFRKIVKKADKTLGTSDLADFLERLGAQEWVQNNEIEDLLEIIEEQCNPHALSSIRIRVSRSEVCLAGGGEQRPFNVRMLFLAAVAGVVVALLPIIPADKPQQQRCLAVLVGAVVLWVSHGLPFFATSILVPALFALFHVLSATDAVVALFDRVTVLALGGFTISAVLGHARIESRASSALRSRLSTKPRAFLLAIVVLSFLVAAAVTNVTAPLVLLPLVLPLSRSLGAGNPFGRALLLALAFGSNIGGIATPVSSPQNVVAFALLQQGSVSFGKWMAVSVPVGFVCCVAVWALLLLLVRGQDLSEVVPVLQTAATTPSRLPLGKRETASLAICSGAVLAQLLSTSVLGTLGDSGVVSLLLMAVLFGFGLLTVEDLQTYPWQLIFLIGGGNVLGIAVQQTGLLASVVREASPLLPSNWILLETVLAVLVLVVSTFVSHTVAALVLLPFVFSVGNVQATIVATFCCSAAMALPTASLPNSTVLLADDDRGVPFLRAADFLVYGLASSVLCAMTSICLGAPLLNLICK